MKRILSLLLCFALALPLFGCAGQSGQTARVPGNFYYRRTETAYGTTDGVISSEVRELDGISSDVDALLAAYFSGPESGELESPFPRDSQVHAWELSGQTLSLTMNESFSALTGVELSIACVCVAKTFLGLLPITQVRFQAESGLLGGEKAVTLSEESISLYDDSLTQSRTEFTVYYTDRQRRYLIAQEITVNLATEDDLIACLIEAMMTPPEGSNLYSALPSETQLLDYSVDDGLCTVNFSPEFERSGWSRVEAQRLTLLSVVNTLTQLEEITQVEFCTEGNLLVQYQLLTISGPFLREESAIGPVRTGMNEFDATLYLCNGSEQYLAAVPTRLRQSAAISQPETVVEALLSFEAVNGFYSSIPEGTRLLGVQLRNGICYIDLSGEFLSSEEHLLSSVHSIVASVCALDDVYSAQITVEGRVPEGDYAGLFMVLSPQSNWFL